MENIGKKKLFNPQGTDAIQERKIIGGDTTNLFNLNNVKFKWAKEMYRVMMGNFWVPEKVDLSKDIGDYQNLTEAETRALDGIMSFLVFLDSIQTNNIPNIADWITAPEVSTILAIQTYQEAIHSQSYAYIIETVIPADKRDTIYDFWRDDQTLLNRNKYVANIYQEFVDTQTTESFAKVVLANFILEGLYFYNGFNFFYNLASRNLMLGLADEIRYINRDELTHVVLFKNMISAIMEENPEIISQELVHEMFDNAVKQEIEWSNHILGSQILGINERSTEAYTKYLANERIKMLGFEPLYEGFEQNMRATAWLAAASALSLAAAFLAAALAATIASLAAFASALAAASAALALATACFAVSSCFTAAAVFLAFTLVLAAASFLAAAALAVLALASALAALVAAFSASVTSLARAFFSFACRAAISFSNSATGFAAFFAAAIV